MDLLLSQLHWQKVCVYIFPLSYFYSLRIHYWILFFVIPILCNKLNSFSKWLYFIMCFYCINVVNFVLLMWLFFITIFQIFFKSVFEYIQILVPKKSICGSYEFKILSQILLFFNVWIYLHFIPQNSLKCIFFFY